MATELNRMLGESQYHLGNSGEAIGYLTEYVNAVDVPERSALLRWVCASSARATMRMPKRMWAR